MAFICRYCLEHFRKLELLKAHLDDGCPKQTKDELGSE
jgi:hypothetical protein